ncbi:MAG: CBS domain-containing protein [Spirochaetia bacterium]|nr:CBS domain-containing protein [Spirochaetia bacterium]
MATVPINTDSGPSVVLELLYRLKVRDAMSGSVVTGSADMTLREIQLLMKKHAITGVPIVEQGRLLGLVSIGDIIQALDEGTINQLVRERMNTSVISLDEDMPLSFAVTYFERYNYGRFPVLGPGGSLVGIITASDIVRRLLVAMNEEISKLEKRISTQNQDNAPDVPTVMEMSFAIAPLDFAKAGLASTKFKKALTERGCPPELARRAAIISYELELNQVIHSVGGVMRLKMMDSIIEITAQDEGPGIPDLEKAMQEGYSTANEWIRSLGFGAGMGLPNAKRVADRFTITSKVGKGTTVTAILICSPGRN